MQDNNNKYDALVIGGGIAGQETALNLADMDYKVLLVEKSLSIGGKMIQLSKVFPTLDCAACITTPKMSETARHSNITSVLNSEIKSITKEGNDFHIEVTKNPRYVIQEACTGCQLCEVACPEVRPDTYNCDLGGRKVAYIPFSLANPRIATIDRQDTSAPCINRCPGGVKAYGYVSLVRNGQYEDAMRLHLEDNPLPGSLSRACYAPCQEECTRTSLEGAVDIRKIKRYFTDYYYKLHPDPVETVIPDKTGKKIAIIGSGPAGLTAAYFLSLKGHSVKIFEAASELGGMLGQTLPVYRLPKELVQRDIKNILSLGVEYELNKKITNLKSLLDDGFDSAFISVGTHDTTRFGIEGTNLDGIIDCLDFLKKSNNGELKSLTGKKIMVFGGGNTAMDAARTSLRLGAKEVTVVYRRSRDEMPCFKPEILEAEEEGVKFLFLRNPVKFIGINGQIQQVELVKMNLGKPGTDGRPEVSPIKGSEYKEDVDYIIEAIGLRPSSSVFSDQIAVNKNGTIQVNDKTLQTTIKNIFSGGDVVSGASTIIEAAGQGKRAAFYIDKFLNKLNPEDYEFGDKLPAIDKSKILSRNNISFLMPAEMNLRPINERVKDFKEIETTFSDEEVIQSANRCLDCSNCRECHQCVAACPANAIDFSQKKEQIIADVNAVIVSTGFHLYKPTSKLQYGYGRFPNVVDSLQMDRLIAPTRPYNNILRPGDGKIPDNIAYILCTGSRDSSLENSRGCSAECSNNPICSQICCMYSIKQAQLLMGALPIADITIYYMDIRAFGKGYEEFFQQTKSMGVNFIKAKVAKISENANKSCDLILRYEDINTGLIKESKHDMVVLSVGVLPDKEIPFMFKNKELQLDEFNYVKQIDELVSPSRTSIDGVFVAGTAAGPKDIPDSILSAGCAATETASYLENLRMNK